MLLLKRTKRCHFRQLKPQKPYHAAGVAIEKSTPQATRHFIDEI
jgi:hypothetical protein